MGAAPPSARRAEPIQAATPPDDAPSCPAEVVLRFMEPDSQTAGDTSKPRLRRWVEISDAKRITALERMAANEPACLALGLYEQAWRIAPPPAPREPTLFIALEPGGNHARQGFELVTGTGQTQAFATLPYLILDEDARTFRVTLLHETGHALHGLLRAGADEGEGDEDTAVAPIPHSTAAITDRRTALNEGFAIHLETVNAHCGRDVETTAFYGRRKLGYGPQPGLGAEFYGPVRDLLSYAQTFARYQMVRDGLYAFEVAPATQDYLRVQLDPARDLRTLRDPGSLMASEGFVASFFFHLVAGDECPRGHALASRYQPIFAAMRAAETTPGDLDHVPLVDIIAALLARDRALGQHAIEVFLDLSHGVTMDADAPEIWAKLFDVALHVDIPGLRSLMADIDERRASWREQALADVSTLARRVGPVVVVEVPGVTVELAIMGQKALLWLDINAAGAPLLRLVPGITEDQIRALLAERARAPFQSVADLWQRMAGHGLPGDVFKAVTP